MNQVNASLNSRAKVCIKKTNFDLLNKFALKLEFSIVIPVFNRPDELDELLESIVAQNYEEKFEVIVVDDGSNTSYNELINIYEKQLDLKYCFKKNSGPGDSRNYGIKRAKGNYFILLDSDCLLPENYLSVVAEALSNRYVDAYGGPDKAHPSFNHLQKAINYSMTSYLSTGGLRGTESSEGEFQLRSFNMGFSKMTFLKTKGFSKQRIGEDIDFSLRVKDLGFRTRLIPEAFVYHKRRTSLSDFFKQTRNFGAARPILNKMHPGTAKLSYWLPSLFFLGLILAILLMFTGIYYAILVYLIYLLAVLIDSYQKNKDISVAIFSVLSVCTQFIGYGAGFMRTSYRLAVKRMELREAFPKMFA